MEVIFFGFTVLFSFGIFFIPMFYLATLFLFVMNLINKELKYHVSLDIILLVFNVISLLCAACVGFVFSFLGTPGAPSEREGIVFFLMLIIVLVATTFIPLLFSILSVINMKMQGKRKHLNSNFNFKKKSSVRDNNSNTQNHTQEEPSKMEEVEIVEDKEDEKQGKSEIF